MTEKTHRVTVVVEGQTIDGWESYRIDSKITTPADAFTMACPFDPDVYRALRLDARIKVAIDGTPILTGYIGTRSLSTRNGTITIGGRDVVGRLVNESSPTTNYAGLTLRDAVKLLASPWVGVVTLNGARDRNLRRGKGRRVPSGTEPLEYNPKTPTTGRVHPGVARWQAIQELVSQAGLIAWLSADGRELFVGEPNQSQAAQYLVRHTGNVSDARNTCKDLEVDEDIEDMYSLIQVTGAGAGTPTSYGADIVARRGVARDGLNNDGTGNRFIYPKPLLMPERGYATNGDAQEIAERELARRSFKAKILKAVMPGHGQILSSVTTLFACNTMARVMTDATPEHNGLYLVTGVTFEAGGDEGERTSLELVPKGTEVTL